MAALIRDLVDQHVLNEGPPPTDLSDLIGIIRGGPPTDVARDRDRMLDEALSDFR
jgi:hypothetical protein